jgi:hypothetical protein
MNGSGCNKCGRIKVIESRKLNTDEFISRARKIHHDFYDYTPTEYVSFQKHVNIMCPKHGIFKQKPSKHLCGQKCKKCSSETYLSDFVDNCKLKYPDYIYDKVEYRGMYEKVIIGCRTHGYFETTPTSFFHKGRGCKICKTKTTSKMETQWLDLMGIPKSNRNVYLKFGNKIYCVDGIDFDRKIVYEFYGDFFHGNPDKFDPGKTNPLIKETFGSLYEKTIEKEKIIKLNGYEIVSVWESDFLKKNI